MSRFDAQSAKKNRMLLARMGVIVGAVVLVATAGCLGPNDPRAYPGTRGDRSLDELLTESNWNFRPARWKGYATMHLMICP